MTGKKKSNGLKESQGILNFGNQRGGVTLDLANSILEDVRESVGIPSSSADFDAEIIPHINSAIATLNQNGVGKFVVIESEDQTWSDLQDPLQIEGNKFFHMIPQFISLNVKILFDPPPPSAVQYYANNIEQTLWRLKIAYEEGGDANA